MTSVAMTKCPQCNRNFPTRTNKTFCSAECRWGSCRATKLSKDAEMWHDLSKYIYQDDEKTIVLGNARRCAHVIARRAPPFTTHYRLGTIFPASKDLEIRWFPRKAGANIGCWQIKNDFEHPKLPFPANYAVAYFIDRRLVQPPTYLITLAYSREGITWSQGSQAILID